MTGVLRDIPSGVSRLSFRISRYGVNAISPLWHNCARKVGRHDFPRDCPFAWRRGGFPRYEPVCNAPSQTRGAINLPDKEFRSVNPYCFQ